MSFLKHVLFSILPDPRKLNAWVGEDDLVYRLGYGLFWIKLRLSLAMWHRRELVRCDPGYIDREAEIDLVKARMRAQAEGMSASDPRYPDLHSISRRKGE